MAGRLTGRTESDVVDDLIRQYLREIGAYPLLTAADEVNLAMAMEAGREAEAVLASAADSLTRARRRQLQRRSDNHAGEPFQECAAVGNEMREQPAGGGHPVYCTKAV